MENEGLGVITNMPEEIYAEQLSVLDNQEIMQMQNEIMELLETNYVHYYGADNTNDLATAYEGYTEDEIIQLFAEHKTFRKVMMAIGTPASHKILESLVNELTDSRNNRVHMLRWILSKPNDISQKSSVFLKTLWVSILEYAPGSTDAARDAESIRVWQQALINARRHINTSKSL